MWLIAGISLIVAPLALLFMFQLQFLPYHNWPITLWHRIMVFTDVVLLWILWPSIAHGALQAPIDKKTKTALSERGEDVANAPARNGNSDYGDHGYCSSGV